MVWVALDLATLTTSKYMAIKGYCHPALCEIVVRSPIPSKTLRCHLHSIVDKYNRLLQGISRLRLWTRTTMIRRGNIFKDESIFYRWWMVWLNNLIRDFMIVKLNLNYNIVYWDWKMSWWIKESGTDSYDRNTKASKICYLTFQFH